MSAGHRPFDLRHPRVDTFGCLYWRHTRLPIRRVLVKEEDVITKVSVMYKSQTVILYIDKDNQLKDVVRPFGPDYPSLMDQLTAIDRAKLHEKAIRKMRHGNKVQ